MDESTGGGVSNDADDYFVEASLWVDGDKVATIDVDDFAQNDYSVIGTDDYRLRFSGLDLVFANNDEPEFQVAFEVVNNLDSADLAGADWDIVVEGIRYVDGEGFTDSDTTTITDSFTFSAEEVAELEASTSSEDPEAKTIEVSDSDTTDDVEVFVFEVEEKNGVDVTVQDLTVTVTTGNTSGETDEAVVVTEAKLFNGSDELDSQNVPTGGVVAFENIDLAIDADETVDLSVQLSFADADDYAAGTDVSVAFTSFDEADDANGNDEGDMTLSGTPSGEEHELREEGISVEFVSAEINKTTSCDGACASGEAEVATAEFVFNVSAIGADAFIIDAVDTDGSYSAGAGTVVTVTGSSTVLADMSVTGDADLGSTHFQIEEDEEAVVTVTVYVTADTDPSALYEVVLSGIEWNDTDNTTTPVNYTLDLGDFETGTEQLFHTN